MTPHPAGEREPPTSKSRQLIISGAYANDTPLQPQSERSKRRRQWVGPRENHAGGESPVVLVAASRPIYAPFQHESFVS